MLKNISWTDYLIVVAIALAIYYLFVGVRYFSTEIKELLSGKRKLRFRAAGSNGQYEPVEEKVRKPAALKRQRMMILQK